MARAALAQALRDFPIDLFLSSGWPAAIQATLTPDAFDCWHNEYRLRSLL